MYHKIHKTRKRKHLKITTWKRIRLKTTVVTGHLGIFKLIKTFTLDSIVKIKQN